MPRFSETPARRRRVTARDGSDVGSSPYTAICSDDRNPDGTNDQTTAIRSDPGAYRDFSRRWSSRAATATCEGAVSYDLSGEHLIERRLSGRPHPAPGPRTRRASAGQRYIRWFFRQYYRDPSGPPRWPGMSCPGPTGPAAGRALPGDDRHRPGVGASCGRGSCRRVRSERVRLLHGRAGGLSGRRSTVRLVTQSRTKARFGQQPGQPAPNAGQRYPAEPHTCHRRPASYRG